MLCLAQLFAKLQAVKAEIHDVQEEHIKERQELEQTQNELTRELKLKYEGFHIYFCFFFSLYILHSYFVQLLLLSCLATNPGFAFN